MGTKDIDITESSDKSMYMMSVNVYNVCNKIISPEADIKSSIFISGHALNPKQQNKTSETKPSKTYKTTETNKTNKRK